jgi:hypothetical protein
MYDSTTLMIDPSCDYRRACVLPDRRDWSQGYSTAMLDHVEHPWISLEGTASHHDHHVILEIGYQTRDTGRFPPGDMDSESARILSALPDLIRRHRDSSSRCILLTVRPYLGPPGDEDHRWCPGGDEPDTTYRCNSAMDFRTEVRTGCPVGCKNEKATQCKRSYLLVVFCS